LINIILKNKVNFYLQRSGSDDVRGKKRKKLFKNESNASGQI
jgi:hypothetical protein